MSEEEKHVKALFYVEPKGEHIRVQNIGCRMLLTEKLIRAGFKKRGVMNLQDGRVEVVLKGNREDIEKFYKQTKAHLLQWLEARTLDKMRLMKLIGNPGIRLSNLEFNESIRVLDIGLYSHSLELGQLQKGVDAYIDMTKAIKKLTEVLDRSLKCDPHCENDSDGLIFCPLTLKQLTRKYS